MSVNSNKVIILTRTLMAGGVCVGAYDADNDRMLRLLDNNAGRLDGESPYVIGETYSMTYATRHNLAVPHIEDVAVYEAKRSGSLSSSQVRELASDLSSGQLRISELFQGRLQKNGSWYATQDNPPEFSVQIVKTRIPLIKDGQHFKEFGLGASGRVKYVGSTPIARLPAFIPQGAPIRYSLARFWDKGDGIPRAYFQLSTVY